MNVQSPPEHALKIAAEAERVIKDFHTQVRGQEMSGLRVNPNDLPEYFADEERGDLDMTLWGWPVVWSESVPRGSVEVELA